MLAISTDGWSSEKSRSGCRVTAAVTSITLMELRDFLGGGIAFFAEKFGDQAPAQITDRTRLAHDGIPKTLAAIKWIAESAS
jgi:hypothetical protein